MCSLHMVGLLADLQIQPKTSQKPPRGDMPLRDHAALSSLDMEKTMARGVNKVILVGNIGADPEIRYMPNGNAVANVTLATSESWKDKQTGQQQERTEWHRVVFFGRLADVVAEYVKKGSQIYVEGSMRTRKWQAQDGQDRYTTEVVVDINGEMQLLGGNRNRQDDGQQQAQSQQRPASHATQRPPQRPQQSAPQPAPQPAPDYDSFDDDIPF